ncbi:MAG TPA: DoxX family protein [Planctomycetota bacterium]|nr:DoxX family protein [Planctomycetota bacterium]
MLRKLFYTADNSALAVVRVMLGIVFVAHGSQKMLGWFGGNGFHATLGFFTHQMGIPEPLAFLAIAAEFFGGLGLIVGLLSRIAAFGILTNMLVAILMVHRHFGFFMNWFGNQQGEGFEYHLLAIAMAFAIVLKGAGAFSLDRAITLMISRPKFVRETGVPIHPTERHV